MYSWFQCSRLTCSTPTLTDPLNPQQKIGEKTTRSVALSKLRLVAYCHLGMCWTFMNFHFLYISWVDVIGIISSRKYPLMKYEPPCTSTKKSFAVWKDFKQSSCKPQNWRTIVLAFDAKFVMKNSKQEIYQIFCLRQSKSLLQSNKTKIIDKSKKNSQIKSL